MGAKRIQICESCFRRVLAQHDEVIGAASRALLAALAESLRDTYSKLVAGDMAA